MSTGMSTDGSADVVIDARADDVYALISDVTRMGEWSPENVRGEWLDAGAVATVGAWFKGYNDAGGFTWENECQVVAAEPGRRFSFAVGRGDDGNLAADATVWTYELESVDGGTRVTESFEAPMLADPGSLSGSIPGRDEMLVEGMRQTLAAIKAVAEA